MSNLKIKCSCGNVEGVVKNASYKNGNHVVCMCIDCQSFAHYLKRPNEILDECGGTEIYQTSPSNIELNKGQEFLKVLRLSPKGTKRWFASCCNSPIANTIGLEFDFTGVIVHSTDAKENKDVDLGPVTHYCMSKYAVKEPQVKAHKEFPKLLTLNVIYRILKGKIFKSYLPNPFFKEDGEPIAPVIVLSKEERSTLRNLVPFT